MNQIKITAVIFPISCIADSNGHPEGANSWISIIVAFYFAKKYSACIVPLLNLSFFKIACLKYLLPIMKDMILRGLNPQQKSAVEHLDSPLFVSAGAGSGKTKVLTHKIAYLVKEKGIRPHRILAITFTKKAANEMAGRVEKMLSIKPMWISTFHYKTPSVNEYPFWLTQ